VNRLTHTTALAISTIPIAQTDGAVTTTSRIGSGRGNGVMVASA
jgi:hypothetical protein